MRKILVVLFAIAVSACASSQVVVLDPGYKLEGRSAADLSAAWWQWAMSSPAEMNPVRDRTGSHCDVGQQGNIWFLAGGFGSSKISRHCVIPAEKYIFFPIINMAYWPTEEHNGYTCEQAKRNAAVNNDSALNLFVELDGVALENPKRYRARTETCFDIFEKADRALHPYRAYPSASDGYWLLLGPLPKGKHTIKFGGRYNTPEEPYGRNVQDIEYEITAS